MKINIINNLCMLLGILYKRLSIIFVPLLFLTFEETYQIPLSRITLLVTINFAVQLLVDLLAIGFVDRIGYRVSILIAHIFQQVEYCC